VPCTDRLATTVMAVKSRKWQRFKRMCDHEISWDYRVSSRVAQSVQYMTTDWTTGRSRFDPRQGQNTFPLMSVSRPALGLTQHTVHWVPGVLSPGVQCGRGVTLTTHPHLVPRWPIPPPPRASIDVVGLLYLNFCRLSTN
jgi:hypothetical protein